MRSDMANVEERAHPQNCPLDTFCEAFLTIHKIVVCSGAHQQSATGMVGSQFFAPSCPPSSRVTLEPCGTPCASLSFHPKVRYQTLTRRGAVCGVAITKESVVIARASDQIQARVADATQEPRRRLALMILIYFRARIDACLCLTMSDKKQWPETPSRFQAFLDCTSAWSTPNLIQLAGCQPV